MEWTKLLNYIFWGTSLVAIATTLIFWKKIKCKEDVETQKIGDEQPNIETQRQDIDLVKKSDNEKIYVLERCVFPIYTS